MRIAIATNAMRPKMKVSFKADLQNLKARSESLWRFFTVLIFCTLHEYNKKATKC